MARHPGSARGGWVHLPDVALISAAEPAGRRVIRPARSALAIRFYRRPATQNKAFVVDATLKNPTIALSGALAT